MGKYSLDAMLLRIKSEKKIKHITNKRLATMTGMPLGTLSKILAGVTKEPSVEAILKISKALEVSADYLIFGDNQNETISGFELTEHEKNVLFAYRNHPDMQPAINKMLDIDTDEGKPEKLTSQTA